MKAQIKFYIFGIGSNAILGRDKAIQLGKQNHQQAIFHPYSCEEIFISDEDDDIGSIGIINTDPIIPNNLFLSTCAGVC